jgi:hypothetical protein
MRDASRKAKQAQRRITNIAMNNEETNAKATDTTAAVAAQGAPVAPEKAHSKKGASQKKNAPEAKQGAKGGKPTPTKKAAKGGKKTINTKSTGTKATSKKDAGKKSAKPAAKPARAKDATTPRPESKGAMILGLIGRPKGATLAEIMKAADWQAHSVRGFISTAGKKHGVKIESSKNEAGERVYRIAK